MTGISSLRASSTEFPMAPRATKSDENTRLQSPDREGGGSSGARFSTERAGELAVAARSLTPRGSEEVVAAANLQ